MGRGQGKGCRPYLAAAGGEAISSPEFFLASLCLHSGAPQQHGKGTGYGLKSLFSSSGRGGHK